MHARLHHVNLIVRELAPARDFYVREFGMVDTGKKGLDYPGAFLKINDTQQLHLAELPDRPPSYRGHFCLRVRRCNEIWYRMKELGIIDIHPWGRVRELDGGIIQFYVRDPSQNLVEITSEPEERAKIDPAVFKDALFGGEAFSAVGLGVF